jgi:hypothetical protein
MKPIPGRGIVVVGPRGAGNHALRKFLFGLGITQRVGTFTEKGWHPYPGARIDGISLPLSKMIEVMKWSLVTGHHKPFHTGDHRVLLTTRNPLEMAISYWRSSRQPIPFRRFISENKRFFDSCAEICKWKPHMTVEYEKLNTEEHQREIAKITGLKWTKVDFWRPGTAHNDHIPSKASNWFDNSLEKQFW